MYVILALNVPVAEELLGGWTSSYALPVEILNVDFLHVNSFWCPCAHNEK